MKKLLTSLDKLGQRFAVFFFYAAQIWFDNHDRSLSIIGNVPIVRCCTRPRYSWIVNGMVWKEVREPG